MSNLILFDQVVIGSLIEYCLLLLTSKNKTKSGTIMTAVVLSQFIVVIQTYSDVIKD